MLFVLSNDDGCFAPGLRILKEALCAFGEVAVVVPDRDRSGASNSLTLDSPLRCTTMDDGVVAVSGTPTDCVHLAITGLLDREPDMVVSGINAGSNLGDDVIYSGTVAAAMEGRSLGLPALAVSLVGGHDAVHFATAAHIVAVLVARIISHPLPRDTILNVNVPDLPLTALQGMELTRLGHRHRAEPVVRMSDPRGRPIYWVGPPGGEQDAGPGTDFHAINHHRVSVTPLQVDLTHYEAMGRLTAWLGDLRIA
jgi:5'-nucleotidase